MMGVFCMTDELVSSLPSCGEGGQLLRNGSPGSPGTLPKAVTCQVQF